jgi:hypothetical protein
MRWRITRTTAPFAGVVTKRHGHRDDDPRRDFFRYAVDAGVQLAEYTKPAAGGAGAESAVPGLQLGSVVQVHDGDESGFRGEGGAVCGCPQR